jgi:hypothetical protein
MVVEILVTGGDGEDPRGEHGLLVIEDPRGGARVGDGGVEGLEESGGPGDLAEQEGTGVGGQVSPWKSATTALGPRLEKLRVGELQSVMAMALLLEGKDCS